jgi:hydrogenase-1 operon protein HyaE
MLSTNDQILARTIADRSAEFRALLDRLEQRNGIARSTAGALLERTADADLLAVLFTDEPHRCPEAWDAAVIFPELLATLDAPPRAVVLPPDESRAAARRLGVEKYPSILVIRGDQRVGVLEGMRDWDAFPGEFAQLLAGSTSATGEVA